MKTYKDYNKITHPMIFNKDTKDTNRNIQTYYPIISPNKNKKLEDQLYYPNLLENKK